MRTDRIAIFLVVTTVFLAMQLITMPYLVYRKKSKGSKISAKEFHDEQLKLFAEAQIYFRRHRTFILVLFVGALIGFVLIDTFR